jgi:hypothetical protein
MISLVDLLVPENLAIKIVDGNNKINKPIGWGVQKERRNELKERII